MIGETGANDNSFYGDGVGGDGSDVRRLSFRCMCHAAEKPS